MRQDIKIPVGITGSWKGLGWKGLKHHPVPLPSMGTFQQSRVLQHGLEKFRDGVTKTQNLHVQDEQGDFGSILFPARL